MAGKLIGCRLVPSEINCSLTVAGREDEVLGAAVAHGVAKHGHAGSPESPVMSRGDRQDAAPALA